MLRESMCHADGRWIRVGKGLGWVARNRRILVNVSPRALNSRRQASN
jgi:hypothetical protein